MHRSAYHPLRPPTVAAQPNARFQPRAKRHRWSSIHAKRSPGNRTHATPPASPKKQQPLAHKSLFKKDFQARGNRSGEGGIRTPDTDLNQYNGLANRRLQPLGHLSDRALSIAAARAPGNPSPHRARPDHAAVPADSPQDSPHRRDFDDPLRVSLQRRIVHEHQQLHPALRPLLRHGKSHGPA